MSIGEVDLELGGVDGGRSVPEPMHQSSGRYAEYVVGDYLGGLREGGHCWVAIADVGGGRCLDTDGEAEKDRTIATESANCKKAVIHSGI